MPAHVRIFGYARSDISDGDFRETVRSSLAKKEHHDHNFEEKIEEFLEKCVYRHGQYDSEEDLSRLIREVGEAESCAECGGHEGNRIFYFALPPKVYVPAARTIKKAALSSTGWNRLILEKPFGDDYASAVTVRVPPWYTPVLRSNNFFSQILTAFGAGMVPACLLLLFFWQRRWQISLVSCLTSTNCTASTITLARSWCKI